MKNLRYRSVKTGACIMAAAVSLAAAAEAAATALQRPAGGPDLKAEQRKREVRETMLRNSELGAAIEKGDQKRIEAAVEQVKQDFKQIQIVRNEIARNILANKPADYKLISGEASEINKRAERLKTYLIPPAAEGKDKAPKSQIEFDGDQMKDALVRLCNLIDSFTENPVLKTIGRVDVEESARAGVDLLDIIELSSNIKRSAERLKKTSK
jgi:hypothetical protein